MRRLLSDRRGSFGAVVLCLTLFVAAAAPVVTTGTPAAQPDVVGARFLPPLATDREAARRGSDLFAWPSVAH